MSNQTRDMVTRTINEGLDDFRMGRASNDELVNRVMAIIESVDQNARSVGRLLGEEAVLDALIEGRLGRASQRHWWNRTKQKVKALERGEQVEA